MQLAVTFLHILLCLTLILAILLQPGKDPSAALMTGGAVNQRYAPRAPGHLLGRATSVIAVLFMCTSIYLAMHSTQESQGTDEDIEDAIRAIEEEEAAKKAADDLLAPPPAPAEGAPAEPVPTEAAPAEAAPAGSDPTTPVPPEP